MEDKPDSPLRTPIPLWLAAIPLCALLVLGGLEALCLWVPKTSCGPGIGAS